MHWNLVKKYHSPHMTDLISHWLSLQPFLFKLFSMNTFFRVVYTIAIQWRTYLMFCGPEGGWGCVSVFSREMVLLSSHSPKSKVISPKSKPKGLELGPPTYPWWRKNQVLSNSCSYHWDRCPEHPNSCQDYPLSSQTTTPDIMDRGHLDGENDIKESQVLCKSCSYNGDRCS